jgi:ABC-type sugar transport system ATPase subunit
MVLARIGAAVDPETRCASMSVGQRQMVEISKALVRQARIVVLDEPTAALTLADTERLFDVIRELKARGLGLIYISHRLEEVFAIADRVTVLRDGQRVATLPVEGLNREKLIEMMVGRRLEGEFPTRHTQAGADRLVVRNLCRTGAVRDVSFVVRRGEVVGLTGLVGAGRTETARLIFGADCADSGSIELDGKTLRIRRPADAIAAGICLLTEDRKSEGLVLGRSVRENFGLPNLDRFSGMGLVRKLRERAELERLGKELDIRMAGPDVPARNLSGGNQQKVVLAKWLERDCEVIMFDEPTRGIDVGAKYEIYLLINRLAAQGKAILMISSELPEVIGMSDRIMVMKQGRVTGEVPGGPLATQEQIMGLAVG